VLPKNGNKVASNSTTRQTRPRNTDRNRMPDPILDLPLREEAHNEIGAGSGLFKKSS
jgi:hypothetical protein